MKSTYWIPYQITDTPYPAKRPLGLAERSYLQIEADTELEALRLAREQLRAHTHVLEVSGVVRYD